MDDAFGYIAHLVQQENQPEADQDHCADWLFAPPVHRRHRRNGRYCRIDIFCGRCIRRLVRPRVGRLVPTPRGARRNRSRRRRSRLRLRRILRTAQVEPVAHLVQAQRIGQRRPVAPRDCRVVGLKRLVKDPRGNEEAEDPVVIGKIHQHREDHYVDQPFEKLAVVHGAHAGYQSQHRGCRGIRPARRRRYERLLHALPCHRARFAQHLPSRRTADARCAERLAAVLAVGRCIDSTVIYAVHTVLLSRIAKAEPPPAKSGLPFERLMLLSGSVAK